MKRSLIMTAALATTALTANAQNLLLNGSFEEGPMGFFTFEDWQNFGNVFAADAGELPNITFGLQTAKMFGASSGDQSDQVLLQTVGGINEGEVYTFTCDVQNLMSDPLGEENIIIIQIAFQDANDMDIEVLDSARLDIDPMTATYDEWVELSVSGIAPVGTTQIKVAILHIQLGTEAGFPTQGGGASFWDNAQLIGESAPCNNPADLNGDGELDFLDISAFLSAYSEGCPE